MLLAVKQHDRREVSQRAAIYTFIMHVKEKSYKKESAASWNNSHCNNVD